MRCTQFFGVDLDARTRILPSKWRCRHIAYTPTLAIEMITARYAYSPSFSPSWSVGVSILSSTTIGDEEPVFIARTAKSGSLGIRLVRPEELPEILRFESDSVCLDEAEIQPLLDALSAISFSVSPVGYFTVDGAISSLHIESGSNVLMAQWNMTTSEGSTEHEIIHSLFEHLQKKC